MLFLDVVAGPGLGTVLAAAAFACAAFLVFGAVLAIPLFRGRKLDRKCACAKSREVMRVLEERERAAFEAKRYAPETVDASDLPQTSPELAEYVRDRTAADSTGKRRP